MKSAPAFAPGSRFSGAAPGAGVRSPGKAGGGERRGEPRRAERARGAGRGVVVHPGARCGGELPTVHGEGQGAEKGDEGGRPLYHHWVNSGVRSEEVRERDPAGDHVRSRDGRCHLVPHLPPGRALPGF